MCVCDGCDRDFNGRNDGDYDRHSRSCKQRAEWPKTGAQHVRKQDTFDALCTEKVTEVTKIEERQGENDTRVVA